MVRGDLLYTMASPTGNAELYNKLKKQTPMAATLPAGPCMPFSHALPPHAKIRNCRSAEMLEHLYSQRTLQKNMQQIELGPNLNK